MFKIIKKMHKKWDTLRASPRGRDVARKATWLCHVDTRACLRGVDVTWTHYLYLLYIHFLKYVGLSIIGRKFINLAKPMYFIY